VKKYYKKQFAKSSLIFDLYQIVSLWELYAVVMKVHESATRERNHTMSIKGRNQNYMRSPIEETMEESFGSPQADHPAFQSVSNDALKEALDTAIKRRALDGIIGR
jgi:hypothetical protein